MSSNFKLWYGSTLYTKYMVVSDCAKIVIKTAVLESEPQILVAIWQRKQKDYTRERERERERKRDSVER